MGIIEFFCLVAGVIAGILATAGYGVLSLSPADFRISRRCFWAAGLLFLGIGIVWGITTVEPAWVRIPAVGVIGLIAAIGLSEGLRWISGRESASLTFPAATPIPAVPLVQPTPSPIVEPPILPPASAPIVAVPVAPSPEVIPESSIPKVPVKPPRIFVEPHVTPEFLVGLYEGNTFLWAETRLKQYIGKWLPVSGPLGEVIGGQPFVGDRIPAIATLGTPTGPSVLMIFRGEWIDRVALIAKGQHIYVHGK